MEPVMIADLVNGKTVIGRYNSTHEYLVDVYLLIMNDAGGRMGIQFFPYMFPFKKEGSTIDVKHIVDIMTAPEEIANGFIESTSGLVLGGPKRIIT